MCVQCRVSAGLPPIGRITTSCVGDPCRTILKVTYSPLGLVKCLDSRLQNLWESIGLKMQHWTGLLVKGKASLQLKIKHLGCAILPIIELIEMFFHVEDFDARVGILTMGIAVVFLWQGQLPQF